MITVCKHGGLCCVSENNDKSTTLVREKSPETPNKKAAYQRLKERI